MTIEAPTIFYSSNLLPEITVQKDRLQVGSDCYLYVYQTSDGSNECFGGNGAVTD